MDDSVLFFNYLALPKRLVLQARQQLGSFRSILRANDRQLQQAGFTLAQIIDIENARMGKMGHLIEKEKLWLEKNTNGVVSLDDEAYPVLLREIDDPPLMLFTKGEKALLQNMQLAVVGSRQATPHGINQAERFCHALAGHGLTITSGLAMGVDSAAHRGAVTGQGNTIAVLGNGLDRVYPKRNYPLATEILESGGLLVSEYPPGVQPLKHHFPLRNRIISGMSLGVLVVEAAQRSGSLITARQAMEQGRDVFALPGSINNLFAKGCHELIRQGAKLVETKEHILEELGSLGLANLLENHNQGIQVNESKLSTDQELFLHSMGDEPEPLENIIERFPVSAGKALALVTELQLMGLVAEQNGCYCRLEPAPELGLAIA